MLRSCLALWMALSFAAQCGLSADSRCFTSPGGRYEAVFEELESTRYSDDERLRDTDRISHVKYRIAFHDASRSGRVVTAEYRDVYGWEAGAKPTPPENLFQAILWSPDEDFAVLDEEGWARAPGAPQRLAVALNAEFPWQTAEFRLSEPVWEDALGAVGNVHDDCQYSVGLFDGRTGQTKTLREAKNPLGYDLLNVVGGSALIRTVLDNCRSEEAAKAFAPECYSVNLDSMQATPATCPMGR